MNLAAPVLQRSYGRAHVAFRRDGDRTRLADLYQEGAAKVRLPRTFSGVPEAVLINTAGGLTDGDVIEQSVVLEADAEAIVTTQACEKLYRARGLEPARITNTLTIGKGARLLWLPQETILYENGRLERHLDADVAPDGRLLLCEAGLLGRAAMGETPTKGLLRERWNVRSAGRLVFAERAMIGGRTPGDLPATIGGPATLEGRTAFATVLLATSGETTVIDGAVEAVRAAAGAVQDCEVGVSGWDGRLVARLVAPGGAALRKALIPLLETLGGITLGHDGPAPLPKVWAL